MEYCPRSGGPKPPLGTENVSINRQREIAAQALTRAKQEAAKVPDPMNHANSGYAPAKY